MSGFMPNGSPNVQGSNQAYTRPGLQQQPGFIQGPRSLQPMPNSNAIPLPNQWQHSAMPMQTSWSQQQGQQYPAGGPTFRPPSMSGDGITGPTPVTLMNTGSRPLMTGPVQPQPPQPMQYAGSPPSRMLPPGSGPSMPVQPSFTSAPGTFPSAPQAGAVNIPRSMNVSSSQPNVPFPPRTVQSSGPLMMPPTLSPNASALSPSHSQHALNDRTIHAQNHAAPLPTLMPVPKGPQSVSTNGPSNGYVNNDLMRASSFTSSQKMETDGRPPSSMTSPPSIGAVTPSSSSSSFSPLDNEGRPSDLPAPYHGQAQYSHQVPGHPNGPTPNTSEPPSHRSTPIDAGPSMNSQQMESLEGGQFAAPATGTAQTSTQWTLTQGQETQKQSIVSGRRMYPQMAGYTQAQRPTIPVPGVQPQRPALPSQPQYAQPNQPQYTQSDAMPAAPGIYAAQAGYPVQAAGGAPMQQMAGGFANMNITDAGSGVVNLLTEKNLLPPDGVELPTPVLPPEWKKCHTNPEVFRCTLNAVPNTQKLLNQSRLPLGILLHPFKDLTQLPVIQSSVIVRCRSCRTYINPFVQFLDSRRWKCNLCFRANDLPEEFSYDPATRTYGEPQRRPEIRSSTIEFIAPSEYMVRPPQPAVYLFVLDVSFCAVETGYLETACKTLAECLDRLPGDGRTQVGFITFDRSLHFYSLSEGASQHQMFVVSDVDEIFLPCPDGLLVNLHERKDQIKDLLNRLPGLFAKNYESASAAGAAMQIAFKLMSPTGGRMSVFVAGLPSVGPGALKSREDPNERSGKVVHNLGPATDFYKKLALECSAQQVAVDVFFVSGQYCDMASIGGVSKFSGGSVFYFPSYHSIKNVVEVKRFEAQLTRYLTRKIGFEAVMRIRCSRGININTFHGNFFVRSTDLLALPNVNPDAGFAMQMAIDDNLECSHVCFQVALLYTSSKGERRIRVHTLCLPVTNQLSEVHAGADQLAIVGLLAKMASDRSVQQSIGDAREALITAAVDMLTAFGSTLVSSQRVGQLPCPRSLRLIPLYILALTKHTAFRVGISTKLDDRVFALESCKTLPLTQLIQCFHPDLYAIHNLDQLDGGDVKDAIPQPALLPLTAASIDRHGVYLMDAGTFMYVWVGAAIADKLCLDIFNKPHFGALPEVMLNMPALETPISALITSFITDLNEQKPYAAPVIVIRENSSQRMLFLQHLVQDRLELSHSYPDFLQHLQKEVKG